MKKTLVLSLIAGSIVGACSAAPISPFSFYGGYFRGSSFHNRVGNDVHLSGAELGVQQSLVSLPILGQVDLGGSVVFGNSNGKLYRVYAQYKSATAPGSNVYGIAALAYYYASGSQFNNQSTFGSEVGVGIPFKTGVPGSPGLALEARYRGLGAKAVSRGFSVGLSLSF